MNAFRILSTVCAIFLLTIAFGCEDDNGVTPTDTPPKLTLGWDSLASGVTETLLGVSGTPDGSTVLTVGTKATVLRFNGTAWEPDSIATTYFLQDVWVAPSGKAIATGAMTGSGKVFECDLGVWTEILDDWSIQFLGVWGTSESNVYVAGGNGVHHYDGSTWSQPFVDPSIDYCLGIWAAPNGEVFVTANSPRDSILHFDGTDWKFEYLGAWMPILEDIWGSAPDDVFAVGDGGTIIYYDGTSWTPMTSGTNNQLFGVWGSSSADVYAVGEMGTILHYDGAAWNPEAPLTTKTLCAVWGSGPKDVYFVGLDGVILHYGLH